MSNTYEIRISSSKQPVIGDDCFYLRCKPSNNEAGRREGEGKQMKENPGGGQGGWEMASGLSSAAGILVSSWHGSVNSCSGKEDTLVLCFSFQVIYLPRRQMHAIEVVLPVHSAL